MTKPPGSSKWSLDEGFHLLPSGRYKPIKSCGITGQGQVIIATDKNTRKRVAVKKIILQLSGLSDPKHVYRELLLLEMTNHNNVINLLSAYTPENTLDAFTSVYLVMPYVENTLDRLISSEPLIENQILNIIYKLVWGVNYLHVNDIIHRDLKPQNIGIDASEDPIIFDFGLARAITKSSITQGCGTPSYMAPEFLYLNSTGDLSKKVDIWSLGCIWIEMINRRRFIPYYKGDTNTDFFNRILSLLGTPEQEFINIVPEASRHWFTSKLPSRPRLWDELIPTANFHESVRENVNHVAAVRKAIENMMKYNPEKRWNTQQILEHFRDSELSEEHPLIPKFIDNTEEFKNACREARGDNRLWKKRLYNRIKKLEREHAIMPPQLRCNRILFYLIYGEPPNYKGRICLFNSSTFKVELADNSTIPACPHEVAIGNDEIFFINRSNKLSGIFDYGIKKLIKSPDPPEWRRGATVAHYKNKLYYIGGEDSNDGLSSCVNILVDGKWQRRPDFPIEMGFSNHVICNDKLYIICFNHVFQLSDDEREWTEVGKMEKERRGPAVASLNGKIYITGGLYHNYALYSCLCFDPSQPFDGRFTLIANMHFKRWRHSLVVANGKLYTIGGYQERDLIQFCKSVEEYDPAANQWQISNNPLLDIEGLSINDTKPSDIPSHNDNETIVTTTNYRQNEKVLFYLLYGEMPNCVGRICLFNSSTFKVELADNSTIPACPQEVAIGNDEVFFISGHKKVSGIFDYGIKTLIKGSDPPEWRKNATVVYYKNKLYYIGGEDSNYQDSNSVNILVDGKWQRGPDFPIEIVGASHVICNDKLYIICFNHVFQLSDDEREWTEVGKMEKERRGPAVASLNGKIYITGGLYHNYALYSCLCFDPSQPSDRRFTLIEHMHDKRYCHSLVVANEKLYAIGGYQEIEASKFRKSMEEYDPATNQWRINNNALLNIKSLSINNDNETIVTTTNYRQNEKVLFYLLYGEMPNCVGRICLFNSSTFKVELVENFSLSAYSYEVAIGYDKVFIMSGISKVSAIFNYETKQLTDGPNPPEWRWCATVAYYKNKLYYIGGEDSNDGLSSCVNILVNGKWQQGPDFPTEVKYASQVICNDKLYIISENAVFQLSDNEREWAEVGEMEGERSSYAVASLNGKIYITGGCDRGSNVFNSCLCFDPSQPSDRRFTSIANMQFNRYGHSLVVANEKLYAIGGYQEGSKFCKSMEEYDPATNRWGKLIITGQLSSPNPTYDDRHSTNPVDSVTTMKFFDTMANTPSSSNDNKPTSLMDWAKSQDYLDDKVTIIMKTLSGKEITLTMDKDDIIEEVKHRISDHEGITAASQIVLVHKGEHLENSKTLRNYNITNLDIIHQSRSLPDFIAGLNMELQTLIKDILNSDTLILSEKIIRIDALEDEMSGKARREYRRWRFEHDKSSVNAFLERQNLTVQNLIRLCLSSQPNLDEFYNSMLVLLPSFDDKEAFLNWVKSEMIQWNRILFYLLYGEDPNEEGRICLFNSSTFKVEMIEKYSKWVPQYGVALGNDQIFLIKGYDKVFEIFSYETKQLAKGPDPPEWRVGATVAYYKNKLYYIGGKDSNDGLSSCVNILVKLVNGEWEWQRGSDFPTEVKYASQVIFNDKLYIISKNAVFQLSDNELRWIEVGKMGKKGKRRWGPAVASLNGKIYITGGGDYGGILNSCLCFDPSQPFDRRFTPIADMHFNRYYHSLVVANGKLYTIGGYQKNVSQFCKSVEEYDPTTNRWRIVGEIE